MAPHLPRGGVFHQHTRGARGGAATACRGGAHGGGPGRGPPSNGGVQPTVGGGVDWGVGVKRGGVWGWVFTGSGD